MAFIGAILGDIAGSQYEFIKSREPQTCELFSNRCMFTDDTVMTLAVKNALDSNWDFAECMRGLGRKYPVGEYKYTIEMPIEYLQKNYRWDVSCQGSVPVAMRAFYESEDFESFMRLLFSLDCDMDTLGAIGGAVVEEFYGGFGFEANPVLERYLDEKLKDILDISEMR